jgi:hypothetical protein
VLDTRVKVGWVGCDTKLHVCRLYRAEELLALDAGGYLDIDVHIAEGLIPLIDHPVLVCELVPGAGRQSIHHIAPNGILDRNCVAVQLTRAYLCCGGTLKMFYVRCCWTCLAQ